MTIKKIFLVGNPNVGKSVVFSRLTGVHVISSNYPGTTVDLMTGYLHGSEGAIEVTDLPGAYSLEPTSKAEEVTTRVLEENRDGESVVIDVVDSTNLERNLFLTLDLIERGLPVIVCLNMCDEAGHRGVKLDVEKLQELLGVPIISTCAVTGAGIKQLIEILPKAAPAPAGIRTHEQRWQAIGGIISRVQRISHRHHTLREILEDASIQPFSGLLMAAAVLWGCFKAVRFIGESLISLVFDPFFYNIYQPLIYKVSAAVESHPFLHHVLIGEFVNGAIDFKQSLGLLTTAPYIEFAMVLPYVGAFYLMLSLLEDIGYLPRLAIMADGIFHRLGLHGYAVIPVLLGMGCNVPGILATRMLESKRERFIAATLISIGVPCVPLQAMIFGFLGSYGGWYVGGVYAVLFCLIIVIGLVLNRLMPGHSPEFLMEIPPYRFPPLFLTVKKLFYRVKAFLLDAAPVVLAGVFVVNVLMYFNVFEAVTRVFAPIVHGLFGLPKESAIALVVGFLRKDVAVGLLMPLNLSVKQIFIATTLLAMSFPCIATFMVLWKELGWKYMLKSTGLMIGLTFLVGALLNLLIAAPVPEAGAAEAKKINVLASFYPAYITARNVMKDVPGVSVGNLTPPATGCLHDYMFTSGDLKKLAGAHVLIVNGAGLESFLDRVVSAYPRLTIVRLSDGIPLINGNPHVWLSVSDAMTQVKNLGRAMERYDPVHKELYGKNVVLYTAKLENLKRKMHSELTPYRGRSIITFHEAFPYFARELGLRIAAVVEREPGSEPGARELADTIDLVKKNRVAAVFTEPQYPAAAAETIARETGIKIYVLDPAVTGPDDYDAYIRIMENNLAILKKALR